MADPNDGFFNQVNMNRDPTYAERQQAREENLAESVVKRILTFNKLAPASGWAPLVRACQETTGSPTLTFRWFHEQYPRFPVTLGSAPIPWVHEITLRVLMDGFLKLKVFTAYKKFLAAEGLDDATTYVALIFRDVRRPMVLHNYPRGYDIDASPAPEKQATRIVHQHGAVTYTLETLDALLSAIGDGWYQD